MAYRLEVVDLKDLPPAHTVLSGAEWAFYQTLKLPKRKAEWLGGRLALKRLLCAHTGGTLTDFTVLAPGGVGKPTITAGEKNLQIPFSLTHSNGFAVATIAPGHKYIGIDLEVVVPRIAAWKNDFFDPAEMTREDDAFLTLLWTQKEALVKLLGAGLTINSRDVRVVDNQPQFFGRALEMYNALGAPQITLETRALLPGFCFSVAVA